MYIYIKIADKETRGIKLSIYARNKKGADQTVQGVQAVLHLLLVGLVSMPKNSSL